LDTEKVTKTLDFLFLYGSVFITSFWLLQALTTIIIRGNPFVYTKIWLVIATHHAGIHALTLIAFTTNYLVNLYLTKRIGLPWRIPIALSLTLTGLIVYDLVWVILDSIFYKPVFFLPQIFLFTVMVMVNYALNLEFHHIKPNKKLFPLMLGIFLTSMIVLGFSGFYHQYHLYEKGLAPDPHGWLWYIGKLSSTYLGTTLIKKTCSTVSK